MNPLIRRPVVKMYRGSCTIEKLVLPVVIIYIYIYTMYLRITIDLLRGEIKIEREYQRRKEKNMISCL